MILLTGATGLVGSLLLERLLADGRRVRCLVRDPRRLGPNRVRVQITLGEIADPITLRQAVRGVESVVHLAASVRDQPHARIEELNGLATIRLLRYAEEAGVARFVFFGALGAALSSPTRFFQAKALAQRAVLNADFDSVVIAPSVVYAPGDAWMTLMARLSLLPWMPVSGSGRAAYQPIWAQDVADATLAVLSGSAPDARRLFELAGPDVLSYEEIARLVLEAQGRRRPIVHVPLPLVRRGLELLERISGPSAFATWEEAELMDVAMTTPRGTEDARSLGVEPKPMREVLGLGSKDSR